MIVDMEQETDRTKQRTQGCAGESSNIPIATKMWMMLLSVAVILGVPGKIATGTVGRIQQMRMM
jgi:hypothetical protein